jgi:hypothetical protein
MENEKRDGIAGWVVLACFAYFLGSGYASLKLSLHLLVAEPGQDPVLVFIVKAIVFTLFMLIFSLIGLLVSSKLIGLLPPRNDP